ncbi:septum formation initiator family protein [bacterium]|nr:septum formation initiator family protein [bacterium]NUN45563.1 septum formation initiator family protein [bacterium]
MKNETKETVVESTDPAEIKKKRNRRILFWSLVGIGALTIISGNYGAYQIYKIKQQRAAVEKEIEKLKREHAVLADQRDRLKTDLEFIEKIAREKYTMIREGERVYQVLSKSETTNKKK